jgi:hypothetical protein
MLLAQPLHFGRIRNYLTVASELLAGFLLALLYFGQTGAELLANSLGGFPVVLRAARVAEAPF